jgi:hypothetical protein
MPSPSGAPKAMTCAFFNVSAGIENFPSAPILCECSTSFFAPKACTATDGRSAPG